MARTGRPGALFDEDEMAHGHDDWDYSSFVADLAAPSETCSSRLMLARSRQAVVATAAFALLCALPAAALANGYNRPVPIGNNTLFTQTTVGTSVEANEPLTTLGEGLCGTGGPEVESTRWYAFRGTGGPMYVTSSGSNFDTLIGFYNGPAPAAIDDDTLCSNDRSATDADSQIELSTTTAGKQYLLQVGGCNDDINPGECPLDAEGTTGLAAFAAVSNDSRSFPETVTAATPVTRTNAGASTEGGEPTACGGATLGKSVWFRFNAPAAGRARFEAVGFDVVLGVFRGGRLACNDDTGDSNTSEVSLDVTPGAYLIQVAGKGAGENATFGNFRYRADFTRAPVVVPPAPPVVTPPVVITEPPPQTVARIRTSFEHLGVWGATGRFTALTLRSVPAGATVRVTCKGKGCRKKKIVKKVRRATARYRVGKLLRRNNRLRPRALVEVRVTAPNQIGKVFRFRIRAFKPPTTKTLCLPPNAKKPRRCS